MSAIRVLVVDDQTLFRQGLCTLLSVQPDIQVIGEAANGAEALRLVAEHRPDVVLMDVEMPILDGVVATRRIRQEFPASQVVILTTFDNDEYVFQGLRAGALGFLLKDKPVEKLVEAVRLAARGQSVLEPSATAKVISEFTRLSELLDRQKPVLKEPLTPRETEILRLIARGLSNLEIAHKLVITEGTVKNHVTAVLSKLDVQDRTQAALQAHQLGIA